MAEYKIAYIGGPLNGKKGVVVTLQKTIIAVRLSTPKNKLGGTARYKLIDNPKQERSEYRYKFIPPKN